MKAFPDPTLPNNNPEGGLLDTLSNKDIEVILWDGSIVFINYKRPWQPCIYGEFIDDDDKKRRFLASYENPNAEDLEFSFAEKLGIRKSNNFEIIWTANMYIQPDDSIWFGDITWKFDETIWIRLVYSAIGKSTDKMKTHKVNIENIKTKIPNSSMVEESCSSAIYWMLNKHVPKGSIDIFSQENMMTESNDEGTEFNTHLHCGPRNTPSRPTRHWADMLPWMIAGFKNFLEKKWLGWWEIQNIKFAKKTYGDLAYAITDHEDKNRQNESYVTGQFVSDDGVKYYFYGKETEPRYRVGKSENRLAYALMAGNEDGLKGKRLRIQDKKRFSFQFNDMMKNNSEFYIQKMNQNEWYMRATIMDVYNIISMMMKNTASGVVKWVVTRYENLHITKDAFSPEQLFDWSCTLESEMLWEPRKLKDGLQLTAYNFKIIHDNKEETLSGTVRFISIT